METEIFTLLLSTGGLVFRDQQATDRETAKQL